MIVTINSQLNHRKDEFGRKKRFPFHLPTRLYLEWQMANGSMGSSLLIY